MKKTAIVLLTLLVAVAGIGMPIWLAIEESERQAFKAESAHALGYARDVVLRSDETGRQVGSAVARLRAHAAAPCAPAGINAMREIDLASTYIQAVGYVEGTRMLCSSIAGTADVLELGPPTYKSAAGALIRTNVRFPSRPRMPSSWCKTAVLRPSCMPSCRSTRPRASRTCRWPCWPWISTARSRPAGRSILAG